MRGGLEQCQRNGANLTNLPQHGSFLNWLEKPGAKGIGDLEDCGKHAFGERFEVSVFICG
jgi:hypothetical protein